MEREDEKQSVQLRLQHHERGSQGREGVERLEAAQSVSHADLKLFDAQTEDNIREVQGLTCRGLSAKMYNIC